ncbi:hypothetical protein [Facilibium subflavum]|uniref:hypothetical protein n=1 Tax=Facilibium subflavum TaxID=2219058 RepID=UPI000E6502AE|nr:hypothetical protein [Facilibium subflavum]
MYKIMKYSSILLLMVFFLSSCTLFVNTAQSQKSRVVPIVPKSQAIYNITQIDFNFTALDLSKDEEKAQQGSLNTMLVHKLQAVGLYQNTQSPAVQIKVIMKKVNDNFSDKSIEAFVVVMNDKGQTIASAVFVERGEGLRKLKYFKEKFVDQLVEYIQSPVAAQ